VTRYALSCPFCGSTEVKPISPWGGQIITSQVRCERCNTYFEAIRDAFAAEEQTSAHPHKER
jgi:C4-type Zn-finger protein